MHKPNLMTESETPEDKVKYIKYNNYLKISKEYKILVTVVCFASLQGKCRNNNTYTKSYGSCTKCV